MPDYSYRDLQKCAEREVALRENVYRKRGMNMERREEILKMKAIAELLKDLADAEPRAGYG